MHPVPARRLTCHHKGAVSDWVPPAQPTQVPEPPVQECPEPAQPTPVPEAPVQECPEPAQPTPVPEPPVQECPEPAQPTSVPEPPVQELPKPSHPTPVPTMATRIQSIARGFLAHCRVPAVRIVDDGRSTSQPPQPPVQERPEPAQLTSVPELPVQECPEPVQPTAVPEPPVQERPETAPPTLVPESPVPERSESSPSTPCSSQDSDLLDNTSLALLEREVTDRRVHQRGTRAPKQLHEPPEHWHVSDSGIVGINQCIDDHPPRTLNSLEERRNRQERRRTQPTPTNARVMSYP